MLPNGQNGGNDALVQKYRNLETKLDNIWQEVNAAPSRVTTIDWSYWESKIDDKKLFQKVKFDHETKSKSLEQPCKVEVFQSKEQFDRELHSAKISACNALSMVQLLENEIIELADTKSQWPFWTSQQHLDSVPGLEAEYDRQAADLHAFTPTAIIDTLETIDLETDIITPLSQGKNPTIDFSIYSTLPPESPLRIAIEAEYKDFHARAIEAGASPAPLLHLIEVLQKEMQPKEMM